MITLTWYWFIIYALIICIVDHVMFHFGLGVFTDGEFIFDEENYKLVMDSDLFFEQCKSPTKQIIVLRVNRK